MPARCTIAGPISLDSLLGTDVVVVASAPEARPPALETTTTGRRRATPAAEPQRALLLGAEALESMFTPDSAAVLAALEAKGRPEELARIVVVAHQGAGRSKKLGPVLVVAVGLGELPTDSADRLERLRRAAGAATRSLAGRGTVALALPTATIDEVEAVATGALLGAYAFRSHRNTSLAANPEPPTEIKILTDLPRDRALRNAVERAEIIADAVHRARDLINTSPGHLPPTGLAKAAQDSLDGLAVTVEIFDEKLLARRGYGGITAVGQGSSNPPRLIRMLYRPAAARKHLILVGKGISFDSGGLSLKPPGSMETMKCDMSGAAAVISAIRAIARLGLPISVTGYAACAENMPSGSAQRPGDVITIYGGTTVEVLNTDAEGRLVLADALVRACDDEPDLIVDVATLTGAAVIAMGNRTAAVMGNNDAARAQVTAAAITCGEQAWAMPLPQELRAGLDSTVADLKNIGSGRDGGMLTAAIFLQQFVPAAIPWVHLDIAGPAFNEGSPFGYTPKGGTGSMVRTLVQLAREMAS